ncbi:hypothetical protein ABZ570_29185 [Micromonospora sp. NPDC007271]|uniref:hypothetical protein n=1 Tax=Micromonospora sp. NPDC007271 TaxID=3154587 RepID=UPI0033CF8D78
MKPPRKLLTTPYRPVTGGGGGDAISGAGGGVDVAAGGRLPAVPLAGGLDVGPAAGAAGLGDRRDAAGAAAELDGADAAVVDSSGSDIAGAGGVPSAYVLRPRTEPNATTISTTMTITPIETTIQGEEVMAAPGDRRARRVPDMASPVDSAR